MHHRIKKIVLYVVVQLGLSIAAIAGPGDTITVQTFTFGSAQDAWFTLPSLDVPVQKILMKYTLKCDPEGAGGLAYPCGEWDYLTYTALYDHTGLYDSTLLSHPLYTANGIDVDSFYYNTAPTYQNFVSWYDTIIYDDTISYSEGTIGNNIANSNSPFNTLYPRARTQYLYTAAEISAAGITPGTISALDFYYNVTGNSISNVKIKLKNSALLELTSNSYEKTGFTTVFNQTINLDGSGWQPFHFTNTFTWDGISNIVADISYDDADGASYYNLATDITPFSSGITSEGNDHFIHFTTPSYADVIDNALADLTGKVTISFWAYGDPDYAPQNGTTFEAVTETNTRVLNSHTPWGDANVYWDAGNDGGYDRISKSTVPADYEGNWVQWTFTKNAYTGSMKIYKNGVLWHSGTSLEKLMTGIAKLRIGKGNWDGSESFDGRMDEFAIWSDELDETTIQTYLYKDLDAAHPYAASLLLYYHFNDAGILQSDVQHNGDALLFGATTPPFSGEDLFRNYSATASRPIVTFEQGIFTSHIDSIATITSVENNPITIIQFDNDSPLIGVDTFAVWPGNYYLYTYGADGSLTDSLYINTTGSFINEDLSYYSAPFEVINRYELGRYITPYGIGLDLGTGFTYTFDLSDYRPLLHDSVHLSAGNWQELLDMKLLFIEGTPPRNPISVTNLWTGQFTYGLTPSYNEQTPEKTVSIPADAEDVRIKIRVTGHGFGGNLNCSEFCPREHYLKVDGNTRWAQVVWRDNCNLNPMYPQGGTWVYSRSNWCPGAEVATYDFELTPYITPGSSVALDYDAEDYTWNGAGSVPYFDTQIQMVTYGAPNFTTDAAIDDIISPSSNQMWGRKNPICNNPIIRIKNTGSTPLTSLSIEYGIKDFDKAYYNWTGNLNFMESEEVTLSDFPYSNVSNTFEVTVSNPNGVADEYAYNNTMTSVINFPPSYPADIILNFRTNIKPNENTLYVYDSNGNEVFSQVSFTSNTIYKDTLHLPDGCYELYLNDSDGDGIAWWANSDGTGYFKILDGISGGLIKLFNPDFGGQVYQQFTVGNYVDIENTELVKQNKVNVYPNPSSADFFLNIDFAKRMDADISIFDMTGKLVISDAIQHVQKETLHYDFSDKASGIYFIVVHAGDEVITKQLILDK